MLIHPEVIVTPDCPTVKFREPREKIDLNVELPKILNAQGWGLGTYFHVQFINHDRSKLIVSGLFIVTEEAESLHTANPDAYQPMTKTISARKAKQIGEWFEPEVTRKPGSEFVKELQERTLKWNPGKKVHEVKVGDKVLFASADKAAAEKFRDAA